MTGSIDKAELWRRLLTGSFAVVVLSVLGWQFHTVRQLRYEVRMQAADQKALEARLRPSAEVSSSEGPARLTAEVPLFASPTDAAAARSPEAPLSASDAELERVVEAVIDRLELAKLERKSSKWIRKATARAERVVDDMVAEGRVDRQVAPEVLELLVEEAYDTWQIKQDVAAGQLTEDEGMEEYRLLRDACDGDLRELLDEERVAALRERQEGPTED